MVRISLLIFTLLSMFILNACGNNNLQRPANIDNNEAITFRTGKTYGKAKINLAPEIKENGDVVYNEPTKKIFDDVNIEVNWESKAVTFEALISTSETAGVEVKEKILFEGHFNEEGIAYLAPKNNKVKSIVGVRCKDSCDEVVADITLRRVVDGNIVKEKKQFTIEAPPTEEEESVIREISPEAASLADTSTKPTTSAKPTAPAKKPAPGKKADVDDDEEDFDDPGVPSLLPDVVSDEMLDREDIGKIKLSEYAGSKLFPLNLGEKYSGKSNGFYSRKCVKSNGHRNARKARCLKYSYGSLLKGTDVAITGTRNEEPRLGYVSVSRNDKVHYGSGFLVKMIEEAGKLFHQVTPGSLFEVNDLSKKSGGKASPHKSHQNGLDVDIRLPKKTNGTFDYAKTWLILKSFVKLGYVDVVFLNPLRINEICKYLKTTKEKDYQKIFGKLYKESGHKTHMHVRLQCTNHNVGCNKADYVKAKYGVCK